MFSRRRGNRNRNNRSRLVRVTQAFQGEIPASANSKKVTCGDLKLESRPMRIVSASVQVTCASPISCWLGILGDSTEDKSYYSNFSPPVTVCGSTRGTRVNNPDRIFQIPKDPWVFLEVFKSSSTPVVGFSGTIVFEYVREAPTRVA